MKKIHAVSFAATLALAAPAVAQEPPAPGPFPNLATLDRTTDHSSFNSSLAASFYGDGGPDMGLRVDLGGQFLAAQGFGGYGSLPVSYLSGDDESETAIGNLEVGGVYLMPAGPTTSMVFRGGVVLPTGPDDDFNKVLTNFANANSRLVDLTSVSTDITWLRVGASPLILSGNLFLRGDVGVELAISEPEGADIDPLFHLNVGGGIRSGTLTVAGELVTVGTTGDVDDGEDRFLHTVAVSAGVDAGGVRPYGALIIPVDNEMADDLLDLTFAVMAGIEVPIGPR